MCWSFITLSKLASAYDCPCLKLSWQGLYIEENATVWLSDYVRCHRFWLYLCGFILKNPAIIVLGDQLISNFPMINPPSDSTNMQLHSDCPTIQCCIAHHLLGWKSSDDTKLQLPDIGTYCFSCKERRGCPLAGVKRGCPERLLFSFQTMTNLWIH